MALVNLQAVLLQELPGTIRCSFNLQSNQEECTKQLPICPVGASTMPSGAKCEQFDPCTNLNATNLNPICSQVGCNPIARPTGNCVPVKTGHCITSYTCS